MFSPHAKSYLTHFAEITLQVPLLLGVGYINGIAKQTYLQNSRSYIRHRMAGKAIKYRW